MSERMSFTSEYIYNNDDYKTLREVFEAHENSKYLTLAPESEWSNGVDVFKEPIIQGKLGCISEFPSQWILYHILEGVETKERIRFVVMKDTYAGFPGIVSLTKTPKGNVIPKFTSQEEIDEDTEDEGLFCIPGE